MNRLTRLGKIQRISIILLLSVIASAANATTISQVTSGTVPFLLDEKGDVWAFKKPLSLAEPFKLPVLHNVKKIAPFMALTQSGEVYTWDLTSMEDTADGRTQYTTPVLKKTLSGITDIAASNNHFVAVKDNVIFEWRTLLPPPGASIPQPELMITLPDVTLPETAVTMSDMNVAILFQHTLAIGYGYNTMGTAGDRKVQLPMRLNLPQKTQKIFADKSAFIAITEDGHALVWLPCYSKDKSECVKGDTYPLSDIIDVSGGNENSYYVFLKKDGTLWQGDLSNRKNRDQEPHQLMGMDVPAKVIATSDEGEGIDYNILAVGGDHSLWAGSYSGVMKKIDLNF
jgi:hypothetical protein